MNSPRGRPAFPFVCWRWHVFNPHLCLGPWGPIAATYARPWLALTCGHGTSWDDVSLHSWGVPRVFTHETPVGSPILLAGVCPLIFVINKDAVSFAVVFYGPYGAGSDDETPLMLTTRMS